MAAIMTSGKYFLLCRSVPLITSDLTDSPSLSSIPVFENLSKLIFYTVQYFLNVP